MTGPAPTPPTPATGFLKSMPETLASILSEIDIIEARKVEELRALRADRARVQELLSVTKLTATPDGVRLLDGTASREDYADEPRPQGKAA